MSFWEIALPFLVMYLVIAFVIAGIGYSGWSRNRNRDDAIMALVGTIWPLFVVGCLFYGIWILSRGLFTYLRDFGSLISTALDRKK